MSNITHKAQKLASAVYFLTGFLTDQEPAKWKLRTLAVELASNKQSDKSLLTREIALVMSLVKTAGLISETNYEILTNELTKLESEEAENLRSSFTPELSGPEKAFSIPAIQTELVRDRIAEHSKPDLLEVKETKKDKPLKEFGVVSVKKNSRQSTIIGLLKRKKEIMIKDVAPLIENCSEKTIQRELLTMVSQGILRKMGEKRWSRYTLA